MAIAMSLKNSDTAIGQFFTEKNDFDKLSNGNVEQIFESLKPSVNDSTRDKQIPKFD